MNRFDRIVALLILLQSRRVVTGPALAARFEVSLRTIYRDIRTLERAGVPIIGEPNVGYSLAEGYRLPPVHFTRQEAAALFTAEKLTDGLTDGPTARYTTAAMDKLRAVLRRGDRDYLHSLEPHVSIGRYTGLPAASTTYEQLLAAMVGHRVVRIGYRPVPTDPATEREVEPVSLYFGYHWHLLAYCRLRQHFRNFRLDRIETTLYTGEFFHLRPTALQSYLDVRTDLGQRTKVILHFQLSECRVTIVQRLHDTKRQYGWLFETSLPDGRLEMTLFLSSLSYLAAWLLPYAGAVTVVQPAALREKLREQAQQAYTFFAGTGNADRGLSAGGNTFGATRG